MQTALPKVVTIGGGTGSFVVLSGLKNYPIEISAVVAMTDSGGSTGKLRDQLGVLPPGDLRQALVALSEAPDIWRKLFTYRFDNGDLKGHNFGNIFLSAIEKITNSNQEAVDRAAEILQTSGRVLPVTFNDCTLCAEYADGSVLKGEANIDDSLKKGVSISKLFLTPNAVMNLEVKRALERADFVVFGPGDLYTSVLPNVLVSGVDLTLQHINAKKIFIINLMTKAGQTDYFKVSNFINELEKYIGFGVLDYIIINSTHPNADTLQRYKDIDDALLIEDDVGGTFNNAVVIRTDLLSDQMFVQSAQDTVKRSLIRHDPLKIAQILFSIFSGEIHK